jgi:hypothetical protein
VSLMPKGSFDPSNFQISYVINISFNVFSPEMQWKLICHVKIQRSMSSDSSMLFGRKERDL